MSLGISANANQKFFSEDKFNKESCCNANCRVKGDEHNVSVLIGSCQNKTSMYIKGQDNKNEFIQLTNIFY